ncbi:MAG: sodium:solute symporter [Bacteroidota bacterium]|jgi:SSS family transporter|nr:sodium:solute symporter [Bacteroidota bacterium]MEC7851419.1 sodium:solute symporter [Bacteroidota bacterium]MEC8679389.1 sodium:solute symporter [Bacteroidota bacterium]|tara:strand:- start:5158 stop:6585 length:1428 start_codon:yes stop_codon:yes gene_type:complete
MNANIILLIFIIYFLVLLFISNLTSKKSTFTDFFNANRSSPWYLVAFGMIGTSLSGVTFISVPGEVGSSNFSYFQVVLGYLVGYYVIAKVLLPLYYKHNLISIYTYLEDRFGFYSYKAGAFFFLLSRTIGASFRLFLVAGVLQIAIFNQLGLPYFFSVLLTILLIWIYTFKGGIKTIVWTDALQTLFMLSAVIITIVIITDKMNISLYESFHMVKNSSYSNIFYFDWRAGNDFFKQFISGAFIAIVMTGLDQDMMQKNLTCRNLGDAQKNIFWFCVILVIANLLFLFLGALLYLYSESVNFQLPTSTDDLYPLLALNELGFLTSIIFILGIIAAAYSSADSALTSLTTSFCIDFLDIQKRNNKRKTRLLVHIGFSILLFIVILIFNEINDESVINSIFKAAGYTYGPLLGLFSFGIFTKYKIKDKFVFFVCLISPLISYLINIYSEELLFGYRFGFEILLLNGLLTFLGLYFIKR